MYQDPKVEVRSTPIMQMVIMDIHGETIAINASKISE